MTIRENLTQDFPSVTISDRKFGLADLWARANDATIAHLAWHGVKQKMGDAFSTFKGTDSEKAAQADKVLDNLVNNVIRAARESDPLEAQVRTLAIAAAKAEFTKRGIKVTADVFKSDAFKTRVNELRDDPKVRKVAENMVAMVASLTVDID